MNGKSITISRSSSRRIEARHVALICEKRKIQIGNERKINIKLLHAVTMGQINIFIFLTIPNVIYMTVTSSDTFTAK